MNNVLAPNGTCCDSQDADVPATPVVFADSLPGYKARAKILKALAHPARLFIVDKLAEREHCVCELQEYIKADMSTVSKHLSVLRSAGIVADDKRGKQVWYSLRVPCIRDFFGCIEETLRQNASEQMALVENNDPESKNQPVR